MAGRCTLAGSGYFPYPFDTGRIPGGVCLGWRGLTSPLGQNVHVQIYTEVNSVASEKEVLDALQAAIIECDEDKAKQAAQKVLEAKVDPAKAIEVAIGGAAAEVGKKFDSGEYFLPHLVMAADAMTAASDILTAAIP